MSRRILRTENDVVSPKQINHVSPRTFLTIGNSEFFVAPDPRCSVGPIENFSRPFTPMTLISTAKVDGEFPKLDDLLKDWPKIDDVWNPAFLDVIVYRAPDGCHGLRPKYTQSNETRIDINIPDGPYVVNSAGDIFAVSRLYEDTNQSFIGGGVYHRPDPNVHAYGWLRSNRIPVPSRLYSTKSPALPLAGLRFAVKDLIDIAGLETGGGSLAYRYMRLFPEESAPFFNRLIEAGAVLVGKTRCTQFADGQDPLERFEEITPFNPRGDGFQKPSSSSSGSAAACAAYEWLDFTIGTDTGGSIRHPAGVNGLYGMRPSLNSVRSSGVMVTELMDTVGVFARSAEILAAVSICMIDPAFHPIDNPFPRDLNQWKVKLLYPLRSSSALPSDAPRLFPNPGQKTEQAAADAIFESTISALEAKCSVTRHTFSLDELWAATHPADLSGDLVEATGPIYQNIVYPSINSNIVQPMRQFYALLENGRPPFIEPILAARLEYGAKVTAAETADAERRLKLFGDWVNDVLLSPSADEDPEITPILVFPQAWGTPAYRDHVNPRTDTLFWTGFSLYGISYCSGCVDVTVPLGEVRFESKVTRQEEKLPVALSVIAKKGMDWVVPELLRRLEEDGILKPVRAGRTLYGSEDGESESQEEVDEEMDEARDEELTEKLDEGTEEEVDEKIKRERGPRKGSEEPRAKRVNRDGNR